MQESNDPSESGISCRGLLHTSNVTRFIVQKTSGSLLISFPRKFNFCNKDIKPNSCGSMVILLNDISRSFNDGSAQSVELLNSYEMQEFALSPVVCNIINITVISVYSNPKTCPARSSCEWWDPTCADWCPNGAASIQFISTLPNVQVASSFVLLNAFDCPFSLAELTYGF